MLQEAKKLVKIKRLERKLTQQKLADKVFATRSTIGMIESDSNYIPSVQLAKAIAAELEFDWTIFFD